MFVENISQFVLEFIQSNNNGSDNNAELIDSWKSKKNQEQFIKVIKKNNITIKDPDKPKRGKSGYLYFCEVYREKLKEEYPELSVKEIVSKLGVLWKKLKKENSQEVINFELKSKEDRNRYKSEMTNYVPLIRKMNKKNILSSKTEDSKDVSDDKQTTESAETKDDKTIKRSKRKEKDEGYTKFVRSKRNKTRKSHPELDSDGILNYLKTKWEKFSDEKKLKYKNKK
jgi:hypothetical protein